MIVGAGFSHAVSERYPLTDELGRLTLERAGIPKKDHPPAGSRFETWLSRFAEDQPYRSVEDNHRARARFLELTRALTAVLRERELEALASPAPGWLDDLVSVLHARRATVVSFDYDHVLECAVDGHTLIDHRSGPGAHRRVSSDDILDRLPVAPPPTPDDVQALIDAAGYNSGRYVPTWPRQGVADTFRLLKLHGSLSWYWSPDDATGSTLQRWRVPGIFGQPAADDDEDAAERGRRLPGRVPFVVPPMATKSSYLSNLVVRELWGRARDALAAADRVIVIGYSVPAEDQLASGLLADALRGREVDVVIADRCPKAVAERLSSLGVEGANDAIKFAGVTCAEQLVAWWRDQQARVAVEQLRVLARTGTTASEIGLQALWGRDGASWCDDPRLGEATWDSGRSQNGDLVVRPASDGPGTPNGAQKLLDHLIDDSPVERILVHADDKLFPVVDVHDPPGPDDRTLGGALTLVATRHPLG